MKICQNLRRAANGSPESFNAPRQRAAAAAQSAKPLGNSASNLARIACAKTGAAPSVEIPMTSGERLTMAPKEKSQNAGLSITFTGTDTVGAAKALHGASRTNPLLVLKGGAFGAIQLSADDIRALAELPSRDELLARFAGALQAPLVKTAGLLQALPRNFAYGLSALIESKQAA